MDKLAPIVQAAGPALWAIFALVAVWVFRRQLRALLDRPSVSIELPGFKITSGAQEHAAERFRQAQETKRLELTAAGVEPVSDELLRSEVATLVGAAKLLGRPARILWVDDNPSGESVRAGSARWRACRC